MEQQVKNIKILEEIKKLRSDVDMLKDRLVDPDTILTAEEEERLNQSLKELERGEVFTLEDIKRDRENAGLEV